MSWIAEHGIGESRALLIEGERVIAARVRWPGELVAGQVVAATLAARRAGSPRGTARTAAGDEILVDRLPAQVSEGRPLFVQVTRSAIAERGRLKRAQGRHALAEEQSSGESDPFAHAATVRRFPAGLGDEAWDEVWGAAWDRELAFPGGTLLFDVTPGMTVIDIDGELPPRELALAAIPALARALRWFDLGGSIAIDFPTLAARAERQAVDAALAAALDGWPHERTAMNGFGLVQLVARLTGPSLLHRLALNRAPAAARMLLRQAEALEGAGAILLTAHPAVLAAIRPEWIAELERRAGRPVRTAAEPALALGGGHAQIVPR